MGCYDVIWVPCPNCGTRYEAQTKSGPCELREYELDAAPDDVIADVNRHAPFSCGCGTEFAVRLVYPRAPQIGRKVLVYDSPEFLAQSGLERDS